MWGGPETHRCRPDPPAAPHPDARLPPQLTPDPHPRPDTEPPSVLPEVQVPGRERRLLETMQLAIGEFITDSSQGLLPSPRV